MLDKTVKPVTNHLYLQGVNLTSNILNLQRISNKTMQDRLVTEVIYNPFSNAATLSSRNNLQTIENST